MYKTLILTLFSLILAYGCFSGEIMNSTDERSFQPLTELLRLQSDLSEEQILCFDERADAICAEAQKRPSNADFTDLQIRFNTLVMEIVTFLK